MSVVNIDPNKPTREEVIAHNMKVAKANLASELAGKLCESGRDLTPKKSQPCPSLSPRISLRRIR